MGNNRNEARNYSTIKRIYHENYLEDISRRLSQEAEDEKKNCS